MEEEINVLNEKVDYSYEVNQKLAAKDEAKKKEIQNLQNKLYTCENQSNAMFTTRSNNQVCERKLEGYGQNI